VYSGDKKLLQTVKTQCDLSSNAILVTSEKVV